MKNIKVLIAAGGTGGHLYPGIALADELKSNNSEIVFVVKKNDEGIKILKNKNLPFIEIAASGLPRKSLIKLFSFAVDLLSGLVSSIKLLKKTKPDVVIGMGGYISFPVVMCAWILKIPTLIHEQNSRPGLANKILSKFVDRVAISFHTSKKYFPGNKTSFTGNPIRKEIIFAKKNYERFNLEENRFTILVFGGSQGAISINNIVIQVVDKLNDLKDKIQFIHITGQKNFEEIKNAYSSKKIFNIAVEPYISDIENAYAITDLVICRAGATTIAELSYLKIPAILIPYPYATANHQLYNAKEYIDSGGEGEIILENTLTPEVLLDKIRLYFNRKSSTKKTPPDNTFLPQQKLATEVFSITR